MSSQKISQGYDRLFNVTGWDKRLKGEKILEVGSGAGRFTEILLGTGAEITSFDYSNAVTANYNNNYDRGNLNPRSLILPERTFIKKKQNFFETNA